MNHRHLLLLPAVVVLAAACSGGSETDGVATLDSVAPGVETTAASSAAVDGEEAALAFAQCMREQGASMDDPTVDAEGNLQLPPVEFSASPDADPEAAKGEMEAMFAECEQHLDGVVLKGANLGSEVDFEDALLEYAGCMREQGIDMPDPDLWGGTIDLGGDGKGDLEEFEAAHEECREILARVGMDF